MEIDILEKNHLPKHYFKGYIPGAPPSYYDLGSPDYSGSRAATEHNRRRRNKEFAWEFFKVEREFQGDYIRDGQSVEVNTPGFVYDPRFYEISNQRYDTVFFFEVGRYSLRSIYNQLRRTDFNLPNGIFGTQELMNALRGNEHFARIMHRFQEYSSLARAIPIRGASIDELMEDPLWKKNYDGILNFIKGNLPEEGVGSIPKALNEIIAIEDRYYPLFIASPYRNPRAVYGISKDMKFREINELSGMQAEYIMPIYSNYRNFVTYKEDTELRIAFYDLERGRVILSEALIEKTMRLYRENLEALTPLPADIENGRKILELMLPSEFKEKINLYLKQRGLENFSVDVVIPSNHKGAHNVFNWNTGYTKEVITSDLGYYCRVFYKDKLIIGGNASTGCEFLFVCEEGDRIRLVHSSWCQHISAWSQRSNYTGTDQLFSNWEISDWLSGPFAERAEIFVEEIPTIFFGNKAVDKPEKKRQILQEMMTRARRRV